MTTRIVVGWLFALALAVVPVAVLKSAGARWRWFAFGVASWVVAYLAKWLVTDLLERWPFADVPHLAQATLEGIVSALAELGAAAWFLRRARLELPDVLAFGTGVGVFELLFSIGAGFVEVAGIAQHGFKLTTEETLGWMGAPLLIERALTLLGHVASRTLVYVAVRWRRWPPAVVAVLLFAIWDGVASYGALENWDWEAPAIRQRTLALAIVLLAGEAVAAWRFYRAAARPDTLPA